MPMVIRVVRHQAPRKCAWMRRRAENVARVRAYACSCTGRCRLCADLALHVSVCSGCVGHRPEWRPDRKGKNGCHTEQSISTHRIKTADKRATVPHHQQGRYMLLTGRQQQLQTLPRASSVRDAVATGFDAILQALLELTTEAFYIVFLVHFIHGAHHSTRPLLW